MFICKDCEAVFETARRYVEPHGERYYGCPYCAGAYDRAAECIICGEYKADTYVGICRECLA